MASITVDFWGLLQLVFAIRVTSTGAQIVSCWVLLMQAVFYVPPFLFARALISLPSLPLPFPSPSLRFFFFDCGFFCCFFRPGVRSELK